MAKQALDKDAIDARFARVVDAFAGDKSVTQSRMFGSTCLKVKGKVFAVFYKGKFVAKLPESKVSELVAAGRGALFDPGHGRTSKTWVEMPGSRTRWVGLARDARRFVAGEG